MCGIVGYVGQKACIDLIFKGLQKLEYRGYDSAGIAVFESGRIKAVKTAGKLANLSPLLTSLSETASVGMGHTRWATHGKPTDKNAHPHTGEGISVVHNGIIENYRELKNELLAKGVHFSSDTDTEVILHLLDAEIKQVKQVKQAIFNIANRLKGAFALGIMSTEEPSALYAVKLGAPLVVGLGEGFNLFASDPLALTEYSRQFIFLDDGEVVRIDKNEVMIWDFKGNTVKRDPIILDCSSHSVEKGGYRHYMLKEIHEQPSVMATTIQHLVDLDRNSLYLEPLGLEKLDLKNINRIHLVACGTAYYAALLGKYTLEPMAGIPCEVELASEFRYRNPCLDSKTLLIAVTQSGETADTLASVKHAKKAGCKVLALCNVEYSSIPVKPTTPSI